MKSDFLLKTSQIWKTLNFLVFSGVPSAVYRVYFQLVKHKIQTALEDKKKMVEPSLTFNGLILYTNTNSTHTHSLLLSALLLMSLCICVCVCVCLCVCVCVCVFASA